MLGIMLCCVRDVGQSVHTQGMSRHCTEEIRTIPRLWSDCHLFFSLRSLCSITAYVQHQVSNLSVLGGLIAQMDGRTDGATSFPYLCIFLFLFLVVLDVSFFTINMVYVNIVAANFSRSVP
jgi:hypothetical protein